MKVTAVALSLAVAVAAGGTSMVSQSDQAISRGELSSAGAESPRDSRICRWLARSDSDSTVRLWFACRG